MPLHEDQSQVDCSEADFVESHLEWSKKQGRILSGGGKVEEYYTSDRGFPFEESELPHYHLGRGDTHSAFSKWRGSTAPSPLVVGVWKRPLFVGGWDHTTDADETVYNVQTCSLFVDLRVPNARSRTLDKQASSIESLTAEQLRLYARQHVFAGITMLSHERGQPVCTRHHCIDWNYIGVGRSRPNKWWVEMAEDKRQWKEYSYATDERGQHYYFERWESHERDSCNSPHLAFRKSPQSERDGSLVVVGDHFNYVLGRKFNGKEAPYPNKNTLVDLVDAAIDSGDINTARSYLSIEAGHGRLSKGWELDLAIPPWNERTAFWERGKVTMHGESLEDCFLMFENERWDLFECSLESMKDLKQFLFS